MLRSGKANAMEGHPSSSILRLARGKYQEIIDANENEKKDLIKIREKGRSRQK
jgi:hypothetical protein